MTPNKLIQLVFDTNAALDTGRHDEVSVAEVSESMEHGRVIPWLKKLAPEMDLSYLSDDDITWYHQKMADMHNAYSGNERRKWGVENRGLCLLIAWTTELLK